MSKHRQLSYGSPIPQDFLDALQEFIGMQHSNLQLSVLAPGSVSQPANQVQVTAASGNGQVGIAINGLWRYVSASPPPISITGTPGTYDIFACTGNNSFATNPSPPPAEIDSTDYTFTLQALVQGSTPTSPPNYRKIGECVFDGTRITYLRQTLGGGDSYRQAQPGDIKMSAAASAPPGWLLCDGTAYSRMTYGVLYAALGGSGSPFGQGDGANTFNVPDLRGRAPIGVGTASGATGATSHVLGARGGEETHQISNGEMPSHSHGGQTGASNTGWMDRNNPHAHSIADPGHAHSFPHGGLWSAGGSGSCQGGGGVNGILWYETQTNGAGTGIGIYNTDINHLHAVPNLSIAADGGSGYHNTMQPYATLNFFIKF